MLNYKNKGYLGNTNLKRAREKHAWTNAEIEEYKRCSENPVHFIKTHMKIVHVDRGLVPFDLYAYQVDMVEKIAANRFVICKISRQAGKSSAVVSLILHAIIFNDFYSVAIIAHKKEQAVELLSRIKLAYEYIPKWLQQGVVEWNKGSIELENGSKVFAGATSSASIRGRAYNLIYLDEFAFVPGNMQSAFFDSVFPTISSGQNTKVVITSTPKGYDLFFEIWKGAIDNKNDYVAIDVPWTAVPGRDEKWKQHMIRNTSEQQFRVEYDCEFIGGVSTLINGGHLAAMETRIPLSDHSTDDLFIFHTPRPYDTYVICVDTARGVGKDYHAFIVVNITTDPFEIVATFRNNTMAVTSFPAIITQIAHLYNEAFVLVEINDIGGQVADMIHNENEYENLIRVSSVIGKGQRAGGTGKSQPGLRMTKTTKRIGCQNIKNIIEKNGMVLNDESIIQELSHFVEQGDSFAAEAGYHDDLCMCLVQFGWLSTQQMFKDVLGDISRSNDEEKHNDNDIPIMGLYSDGTEDLYRNDAAEMAEIDEMFSKYPSN